MKQLLKLALLFFASISIHHTALSSDHEGSEPDEVIITEEEGAESGCSNTKKPTANNDGCEDYGDFDFFSSFPKTEPENNEGETETTGFPEFNIDPTEIIASAIKGAYNKTADIANDTGTTLKNAATTAKDAANLRQQGRDFAHKIHEFRIELVKDLHKLRETTTEDTHGVIDHAQEAINKTIEQALTDYDKILMLTDKFTTKKLCELDKRANNLLIKIKQDIAHLRQALRNDINTILQQAETRINNVINNLDDTVNNVQNNVLPQVDATVNNIENQGELLTNHLARLAWRTVTALGSLVSGIVMVYKGINNLTAEQEEEKPAQIKEKQRKKNIVLTTVGVACIATSCILYNHWLSDY